jgi:hypothetical protein
LGVSSDEWAKGLTFAPGPALRIGFVRARYEVTKDLPDDAERRVRCGVNSGSKHSGVRTEQPNELFEHRIGAPVGPGRVPLPPGDLSRCHAPRFTTSDQSGRFMVVEQRIGGRSADVTSPSSHQRVNLIAEAHRDLDTAVSLLAQRLRAIADDVRARAAAIPDATEAPMLADLADGLEDRVRRLQSS